MLAVQGVLISSLLKYFPSFPAGATVLGLLVGGSTTDTTTCSIISLITEINVGMSKIRPLSWVFLLDQGNGNVADDKSN